jgi:transposase
VADKQKKVAGQSKAKKVLSKEQQLKRRNKQL